MLFAKQYTMFLSRGGTVRITGMRLTGDKLLPTPAMVIGIRDHSKLPTIGCNVCATIVYIGASRRCQNGIHTKRRRILIRISGETCATGETCDNREVSIPRTIPLQLFDDDTSLARCLEQVLKSFLKID